MQKQEIIHIYQSLRQQTEKLCRPLLTEDYIIQGMEDVSPPKWHLAHSSWFFETFLLKPKLTNYEEFNPHFGYLFNSYYQNIGNPYPRAKRGLLSRPSVEMVYDYRHYVDRSIIDLIKRSADEALQELNFLMTLGFNHEQQHQELLLMDIKYNFFQDPSYPCYQKKQAKNSMQNNKIIGLQFIEVTGRVVDIGHTGNSFCFDNELPQHKYLLPTYSIANRLVTNGEYLEFIAEGGYQDARWWLSDGWDCLLKNQWQCPLYWQKLDKKWHIFTLNGLKKLNPNEPVSHISFYEADAYARWCGLRLPTEYEWEYFVNSHDLPNQEGNFLESEYFHPNTINTFETNKAQQFYGDLWEWTSSPYSPYPGYTPFKGGLGEYNGKFMMNQMVLRGGSCITPQSHIRASYRNFFQPEKRWLFSGFRLAQNIEGRQ